MATELFAVFGNDLALQLTPVGEGRFEVYLDERKIWDRKEAPGRPYPNLAIIRDLREVIDHALAALPAAAE
jgi:predicted Rdx family selenoprotein